jgi:phage baseplate assembly protein V
MLDHNFAISELNRKLANIIRIGLVKEIDYEKARVKVQIGDIVTDYLPWIMMKAGEDRSWFALSIGKQIIVLSPLGEVSLGAVLAGIYQQRYSASENKKEMCSLKFQDGAKLSYDREKRHFEVEVVDKITLQAGKSKIEMTKSGIKLKADRIDLN